MAIALALQVSCTLGGQEGEDLTPTGTATFTGGSDTDTLTMGTATTTGTSATDLTDSTVTSTETGIQDTGAVDTGLVTTADRCGRLGPLLEWAPPSGEGSLGPADPVEAPELRVEWTESEADPMRSTLVVRLEGRAAAALEPGAQLVWRWPAGLALVDVDATAVGPDAQSGDWVVFSGELWATDTACWRDEQMVSMALITPSGTLQQARHTTLGSLRLDALDRPAPAASR